MIFPISLMSSCAGDSSPTLLKPSLSSYQSIAIKAETKENNAVVKLDLLDVNFPISIFFFKTSERTFIETSNSNLLLEDLSWTLKDDLSLNTDELFLFMDKDDYILMFPLYSEEFPTYHLLGISKTGSFEDYGVHTYSFKDVENLKMKFPDVNYSLEDRNDTLRIYANASRKILLSKLEFINSQNETISRDERAMIDLLLGLSIKLKNGEWQPDCAAPSGYFKIINDELELDLRYGEVGVLSISLKMRSIPSTGEVHLFFENIINCALPMGDEEYYSRPPSEVDISKDRLVGRLIPVSANRLEFVWDGLYHLPTKKTLYLDNLDYKVDKSGKIMLNLCN